MADASYQAEKENILSFLKLQKTNPEMSLATETEGTQWLVSPRYQKKFKPKQVLFVLQAAVVISHQALDGGCVRIMGIFLVLFWKLPQMS